MMMVCNLISISIVWARARPYNVYEHVFMPTYRNSVSCASIMHIVYACKHTTMNVRWSVCVSMCLLNLQLFCQFAIALHSAAIRHCINCITRYDRPQHRQHTADTRHSQRQSDAMKRRNIEIVKRKRRKKKTKQNHRTKTLQNSSYSGEASVCVRARARNQSIV